MYYVKAPAQVFSCEKSYSLQQFWVAYSRFSRPYLNSKVNLGLNHLRCSIKKGVFKNFAKFSEKHLCQSLIFNKVACWGL